MHTPCPNFDYLCARLLDLHQKYDVMAADFKAGDIVRWKPGLMHLQFMGINDSGVIVSILDKPLQMHGLFPRQPEHEIDFDVEIGAINNFGKLVTFRTNLCFLEPELNPDGRRTGILQEIQTALTSENEFAEGQLVRWHRFCAPSELPQPDLPGIVIRKLDTVRPEQISEHPFDRIISDPQDLEVAIEDREFGFKIIRTDQRRVRPYSGPIVDLASVSPEHDGNPDIWAGAEETAARTAARLILRHASFSQTNSILEEGAIVRWKPGLRNTELPLDEDSAIVLDYEAESATEQSEDHHLGVRVKLGYMDQDGQFGVFWFDEARFERNGADPSDQRVFLERAYEEYSNSELFSPGDLITWKHGLGSELLLDEGKPAVVLPNPDIEIAADMDIPLNAQTDEDLLFTAFHDDAGNCHLNYVERARMRKYELSEESDTVAELHDLYANIQVPQPVFPGRFVKWRKGFVPPGWLDPEEYGIVIEEAGPHHIRVGFLDGDDGFFTTAPERFRVVPADSHLTTATHLLEQHYNAFTRQHSFKPGEIVYIVDGLSGWNVLELTEEYPGIVLRVLDPPIHSRQEETMAEDYRARADLLVAGLDGDDDFVVVHADSRRLASHPQQNGPLSRRLKGFRRRFKRTKAFKPGDLVAWKENMCANPDLEPGLPAVVFKVYDKAIAANSNHSYESLLGSAALAERFDTIVGTWHNENLKLIACDSRRLEPFDDRIHCEIYQRTVDKEARELAEFSRMLDDFDDDDLPF